MKQFCIVILLSMLAFGVTKRKPVATITNPPCSMGSIVMGSDYEYYHSSKIIKGKCLTEDLYRLKTNGRWEEVTEEKFYHKTCWEKHGTDMQGMVVDIYPRPEWNECQPK